jgi:sarcosine oxidase, subunit alpha
MTQSPQLFRQHFRQPFRQPFRLLDGGLIDRTQLVDFSFNGRRYQGYVGDTLASALLANGVDVVARSFKYHRKRGIMAAGEEECNALLQIGTGAKATPNVRATEILISQGLEAKSQNAWPSLNFDILGLNDRLSRFLSAGFYYKTFMWPSWHLFEGAIRRSAGIGKAASAADPDRYEHRYAHCDVLVVGAGLAGLTAARAAVAPGVRVMLVEQDARPGGGALWNDDIVDGIKSLSWAEQTYAALKAEPECHVLLNTAAVGYFDHNALTLLERVSDDQAQGGVAGTPRLRLWQVRAKHVILATGAIERPLVFGNNDLPGIMLSTAIRHYIRRYGVAPGRRALICTNNDDAYLTAIALHDEGISVAALVDVRTVPPPMLAAALSARNIKLLSNATLVEAKGRARVNWAIVHQGSQFHSFDVDLIGMSGGMNPNVSLFSQSGGTLVFDSGISAFKPDKSVQSETSIGSAAGLLQLDEALAASHVVGATVLGGSRNAEMTSPSVQELYPPVPIQPLWQGAVSHPKAFVDFHNDVTVDDIALAARENFRSIEHLKRYTTLGMAADQGKTANVNGLAIMAELTGQSISTIGTTRFRFPYTPIALGAFAGRQHGNLYRPLREMPGHDRHVALNAFMEEYSGWSRPTCYQRSGESRRDAEAREVRVVRYKAGLFEGSPLGKIEVIGPDAARFLDLIYANTISTLKIGKMRYGLMLNELGVIKDDGAVARLADTHFLIFTSSGGADSVAAWLEEWLQCEWVNFQVIVAPVTTASGVLILTGPNARAVLSKVGTDFDVSAEAFPHMSYKQGLVGGISAHVNRMSYTGEVSFEICIPARQTALLWDSIIEAGATLGLEPVGIDAWIALRTEKGNLLLGADTDGTTLARDVGWKRVLNKKSDFVGKRSLFQEDAQRADRFELVGLTRIDRDAHLAIGTHLTRQDGTHEGYVTSSCHSPILNRFVAIGMIQGGEARHGEIIDLNDGSKIRIDPPCAYDPEGERLNG